MKIGDVNVPVRFAMRAIALYFESKGKSLLDLSNLQFSEIQDIYWIGVSEGCRREGVQNPYPDAQAFFDALDDNPDAMQELGEEMGRSFAAMNGEEKNLKAPKKPSR